MIDPTKIKKPICNEKNMKVFIMQELNIPEDLYYKFMNIDQLAGMTVEKHEQLLKKAEEHFGKKLIIPPYLKMFSRPSQIMNGLNQKGKRYARYQIASK